MKHELLAPAGNIEAGYAALYYGADAVYLGLTKFSARAGAENFTPDELNEFTAYAHSLGKKVFVALNTILTEDEVDELPDTFKVLKKAKVDALIVQDLGVFYLAKKLIPEIELHASTQMAVHNLEGARFLQSLGFKRVVLARELTISEIKKIADALPDLDLEVFVHGALCYSYSGQCLFSALEYGKSANRGRCIYPCRNVYEKNDGNNSIKNHLFSMKDFALEEKVLKIPALSLKIEGRKKSPLYVAAVTNYYRNILDGKNKDVAEANDIKQIFSRPWCNFHFNGKDKAVVDKDFVGHRGLLIGKVERINKHGLGFRTNHKIARYDGIQIDVRGDEKPFGFGVKNLYVKNKSVFEANCSDYVEIELPTDKPHIEIGAPIYLASSSEVKGKYSYSKPKSGEYKNLTGIDVVVEVYKDKVWAMCGDVAVCVDGNFDVAKDISKTDEAIRKAFSKTGGTDFYIRELEIRNNDGLFVNASLLNELRRLLLSSIKVDEDKFVLPQIQKYISNKNIHKINLFSLDINVKDKDLNGIDFSSVWFVLPQICRNIPKLKNIINIAYTLGARKFVAENYYAFEVLNNYRDIEIATGGFVYVLNRFATAQLKEIGISWATPALESSDDNMIKLVNNSSVPLVQVISSYPALFTSAVCIRDNDCANCNQQEKRFTIKKDGKEYLVISKNCQIQLFNKKPYTRRLLEGMYGYIEEK